MACRAHRKFAAMGCGRVLGASVGEAATNPTFFIKRADTGTVMNVPAYLYSRLNMRSHDVLEPKKEPAATPSQSGQAPPEATHP